MAKSSCIGRVELEKAVEKEVQQLLDAGKTSIRIMVSGKTGAGKSSLLNYVFGTNFAEGADRSVRMTEKVTQKIIHKNGIDITVFDTPGFQDSTGKEKEYLEAMKRECQEIDLFIFCVSVLSTRSELGESASALQLITTHFHEDIWKNCIVALTFSNIVAKRQQAKCTPDLTPEQRYLAVIEEWKMKFKQALLAKIHEDVVTQITIHPTGHPKQRNGLPGQEDWISATWAKCLKSAKPPAKKLLIIVELTAELTFLSLNDPELIDYRKQLRIEPDQRRIVLTDDVQETLGEEFGIVTVTESAIDGATVGAVVGSLLLGIPTLSAGVILGALLGAIVGGAIGAGVGAVKKAKEKHKKK